MDPQQCPIEEENDKLPIVFSEIATLLEFVQIVFHKKLTSLESKLTLTLLIKGEN